MARYRGRHRAPSFTDTVVDNSGRIAAAAVATGFMAGIPVITAPAASAAIDPDSVRAAIIECESGNRNIPNSSGASTASGFYQFTNGTWKHYGGTTARAMDASRAEQDRVFNNAIRINGTRDWEADPRSEACWRPKIGNVSATPKRSSGVEAPQSDIGKRRADGTGQYTCDTAHLYFEACDPDNIGEVVNYPAYQGKHRAPTGSRGSYVCDNAHLYFEACDPDNLGETVAYPVR